MYSPVVFKHGCSLETYLQLCRKKKKDNIRKFIFFRKFQDNFDMHLNFEKLLQTFLLSCGFVDKEFYYISVEQS